MMRRKVAMGLTLCVAAACGMTLFAQRRTETPTAQDDSQRGLPAGIVWYGRLQDGLEAAKLADRPILLLSAAPQCAGVPGMW